MRPSRSSVIAMPAPFVRFLILCAALAVLPSIVAQSDEIPWFDNYAAARAEAERTRKPIFLEFRCEP